MHLRHSISFLILVSPLAVWAGCANGADPSDTGDTTGGSSDVDAGEVLDGGSTFGMNASTDDASVASSDAGVSDAGASTKDASTKVDAGSIDSGSGGGGGGGTAPTQGEVLITEVMYNPTGSEPDAEWIEVTNVSAASKTLSGLTIEDGSARTHVIGSGVSLAPGAVAVLARSKSAAVTAHLPAAAVVYEYGAGLASTAGIQLANGSTGAVILRAGSTVISQVSYGGWYSATGASVQMAAPYTFAAGTNKSAFCLSAATFAAGSDLGTPGTMNDCP